MKKNLLVMMAVLAMGMVGCSQAPAMEAPAEDTAVSEEVKSTENVTVDDFTTENSVKLNDMTQAEISTLVQTIYINVTSVLPQKAQLLGISL